MNFYSYFIYLFFILCGGAVDPLAASGLRKRTAGNQGRIRLTLIYESRVQELKIFVHEAAGLPGQHRLQLQFQKNLNRKEFSKDFTQTNMLTNKYKNHAPKSTLKYFFRNKN
jgi:hypothetical protein